MSTEAQLKALSNSELASGIQIPALNHRTVNNAIIEEMYDAQSRGNVLSGVQSAGSLASGDQVFVIRSGQAYLLDASNLDFVSALSDLTDVSITSLSNDQILVYDTSVSRWVNKFIDEIVIGGTITGTGTAGKIAKFTDLKEIGDSSITDDGTTVTVSAALSVSSFATLSDKLRTPQIEGVSASAQNQKIFFTDDSIILQVGESPNLTIGAGGQFNVATGADFNGTVEAGSFVTDGGTSSDFVKGDGSLDSTTYQDTSEKGQANGYAPLDSGAKVAEAYLPDSILGQVSYQGTWNASTNTPTLANPPASTTKGEYYVTSVAGTQFSIDFQVGDWIISNGTSWEKVDNTDAVTSVFGRLGNIVANESDYSSFYPTLTGANTFTNDQTFNGDITLGTGTVFSYLLQSPDLNRYVDMGGSTLDLGAGGADKVRVGASLLEVLTDTTISGNLTVDTNTLFVDSANNRVGIGTSSPSANLHIAGTSSPVLTLEGDSTGTCIVQFADNDINVGQIRYSHPSNQMDFRVNDATRMSIDSSGNVGIGTSSPERDLDIAKADFDLISRVKSTNSTSRAYFETESQASGVPIRAFFGSFYDNAAVQLRSVTNHPLTFSTNNTERMRIDSSGNVGIGTSTLNNISGSNPTLTLAGTGITGGLILQNSGTDTARIYETGNLLILQGMSGIGHSFYVNAATEAMRIDSTGNVGIGTSSPQRQLHVNGATGALRLQGTSVGGYVEFVSPTSTTFIGHPASIASGSTDDFAFYVAGAERMRIDSSGRVGIGTSSPAVTLDVNGNSILRGSVNINGGNFELIGADADSKIIAYRNFSSNAVGIDILNTAGTSVISLNGNAGNVIIAGSLSKGSGSFKIDHPLPEKKDTHHLVHSFVEAPQADNIYRGQVDLVGGKATVNLDEAGRMTEGTFVLLNTNIQTFTSNESDWDAVRGKVEGNILTIECQNPESTAAVNWLVIGERHDQHMMDTNWTDENGRVITEPLKPIVEDIKETTEE